MLTASVITNSPINEKRNLSSCYQVHRVSKYIKAQGIQYITKNTVLAYHTHIYATNLNDRQKLIINRIRHFEERGSFHYCKASTQWWLEFLAKNGYPISRRMFFYDLSLLERLKLIKRNTYETPGGSRRQIYTAWGISLYKKYWLFRKRFYAGELVIKPKHVYEECLEFEMAVEALNAQYLKDNVKTKTIKPQSFAPPCTRIKKFIPSEYKLDNVYTKYNLLQSQKELEQWLDSPNVATQSVQWHQSIFQGLEKRYHKPLMAQIGRLQTWWPPNAAEYLPWLYDQIMDLAQSGKIPMPMEPITYVLKCHNSKRYGQWMDWQDAQKLKRNLAARAPTPPDRLPYELAMRAQQFVLGAGVPNDGHRALLGDYGRPDFYDPTILRCIKSWAQDDENYAVLRSMYEMFPKMQHTPGAERKVAHKISGSAKMLSEMVRNLKIC